MLRNAVVRAIFDHAGDGMVLVDDSRHYIAANPAACALFDRPLDDIIGRPIADLVDIGPAEVAEMWATFMAEGTASGHVGARRRDGSLRRVDFRARANVVPGVHLSLLRDVSDQLAAEESRRAELEARALARALEDTADAERRLAADLHDSLGQGLALVKLSLECIASGEGAPRLDEPIRRIEELIRQTRTTMFELHPAVLDDLGLVPTLEHYTEQLRPGTNVSFSVSETGARHPLARPRARALFRGARELVTNALKHAAPSEIVVAVHWSTDGVRLVVDDDGRGFDPSATRRGLGLSSTSERVLALGGSLTVESEPGSGTRVVIELANETAP